VGVVTSPPPTITPFPSWALVFSFKDDVTVILFFGVSFIGRKGEKVKRERGKRGERKRNGG
jgi:hypothetical protein